MSDGRPDGYVMIGLHKLASQAGDGLVPELFELLRLQENQRRDAANVATFPLWQTRKPGCGDGSGTAAGAAGGENIIAFPRGCGLNPTRAKRV